MRVEIVQPPPADEAAKLPYMEAHKVDPATGEDEMTLAPPPLTPALVGNGNGAQAERNPNNPASWGKVGRNEVCPAAPARNTSTATADSPDASRSACARATDTGSAQPRASAEARRECLLLRKSGLELRLLRGFDRSGHCMPS